MVPLDDRVAANGQGRPGSGVAPWVKLTTAECGDGRSTEMATLRSSTHGHTLQATAATSSHTPGAVTPHLRGVVAPFAGHKGDGVGRNQEQRNPTEKSVRELEPVVHGSPEPR